MKKKSEKLNLLLLEIRQERKQGKLTQFPEINIECFERKKKEKKRQIRYRINE